MIFASLALALLITAQTAPGELEDYQLVAINGSFSAPLQVTAPDGDSRIFIVERGGRVKVAINDSALSVPFIDISARLTHSPGGEQGLLGMAFHPSYDVNGRFFLAHTDVSGDLVVAEFHASPSSNVADPNLVQKVISIDEPFRNHNGGSVVFGTDGLLYIGVGDGGGVGDPFGHGQRTATLLGSILRIDVDGDSFPGDPGRNYAIPAGNPFVASPGADEIWHYGLRNPWRFAIDPDTGRFYVADVGQDLREEVTVLEPDSGGSNLGWDRLEGTRCYPNGGVCNTAGTVLPQVEYSHSVGRSVTGGPVYRGSELPELDGTYFYGDFAAGWIRSFTYNGAVSNHHDWSNTLGSTPLISSFGLDGHGELYVVSIRGNVWRLEGRSNLQTIGDWTGDGRTDLAIRRGGNWLSSTSSANSGSEFSVWSSFATQTGWGRSLTADFDNDGRDDIADFHPSNGTWWVSRSTGSGFTTTKWADFATSKGWGPQLAGDFNGDGRDDIVNYHSSNGTWWVSRSTGTGFTTTKWADFSTGTGWQKHLIGDFSGDGRDDSASFHPSNGTWWVGKSSGSSFGVSLWADFTTAHGWGPQLVGDFDGDGKDDIANYHSSNGTWWVSRSTGSGFTTAKWADFTTSKGWGPQIVGDFNGDGRDDIVNYHSSNGTWWVSRSTGSGFTTTKWAG